MSDDEIVKIGNEAPGVKTLTSLSKSTLKTPAEKTKEGLFQVLNNSFNEYSSIDLTEEEAAKVAATLTRLSSGSSSFALLNCQGNRCPFFNRCPLGQMGVSSETPHGKTPVGKDCILEATLMRDATTSYFQEYEVDPVSYTEVNIVTELAEIEVLLWRINMQLSVGQNALLVIDQPIGFDRQSGLPIMQQQVAPLFEQKQKLVNRKSKLMKVMVGDRQEKYKKEAALKQKPSQDASTQMSEVKKQLQELQHKLNTDAKVVDAEFTTPEDFILKE